VDAAPIDDHHDLFASGAEGGHHLMEILAQLLGITAILFLAFPWIRDC
jgi:hypothetical protein